MRTDVFTGSGEDMNSRRRTMYYSKFDQLIVALKKSDKVKKVAVISAEDEHSLEAVLRAERDGLVEPVLIGDRAKIEGILSSLGGGRKDIVPAGSVSEAAEAGVRLVNEGKADFLMKGKLDTKDLMQAVVNKKTGLNEGNLMSHFAIHELPWYDRLLVTTDGGMTMYPNLEQKAAIIQNSVDALVAMGYDRPNVAVLCAVEKVNDKMPETLDAKALKDMCEAGKIENALVEGPISFDLAVNAEKAKIKGYDSPVAGCADILVAPNITAGNILGKSLLETHGV
ncbi:MAG: phosphate butyryltransferase, partial [Synergistaceae bacterium]|nr:phosphate butyryltransferase [Synergistaceae bacterium]